MAWFGKRIENDCPLPIICPILSASEKDNSFNNILKGKQYICASVCEGALVVDYAEVLKEINSESAIDRLEAVSSLKKFISTLPDKNQAWQDLILLANGADSEMQKLAIEALASTFMQVPDKEKAWQDLYCLAKYAKSDARWKAAESLGAVFCYVPQKDKAWVDLYKLAAGGNDACELVEHNAISRLDDSQSLSNGIQNIAARTMGLAFKHMSDKNKAWEDLHRLAEHRLGGVRWGAAEAMGIAFEHIPNKNRAWQDLHDLADDEKSGVRWGATEAMRIAFEHIIEKDKAWHDLYMLTQDEDSSIRMHAYYSLGRASIYKAIEAKNLADLKEELKTAIIYFEKTYQEGSIFNPSTFCLPFYRSYFSIAFEEGKDEEVRRYLAEARAAVGESKCRDELLKAIESLARALLEAQKAKNMQLAGMQCDLKAYMRFCVQATDHLINVENEAPNAAKLIKKGLPNIDQNIKNIIGSIQEKAQIISSRSKDTGTVLGTVGKKLNCWAKELSSEDILKSERSCARIEFTLKDFCSQIPVNKRSGICDIVTEIGQEDYLPNKLTKIELALSCILNQWPDYNLITKLDEIRGNIESLQKSHIPQVKPLI